MNDPRSSRPARVVLYGSLFLVALLSFGRLLQYDPVPWGLVVAFGVVSAVLAGPVAWAVRDRVPAERRERLSIAGFVLVMLCVPVLLAIGLLTGTLFPFVDAAVFGGLVGFALVAIAERTVLPERFRGTRA